MDEDKFVKIDDLIKFKTFTKEKCSKEELIKVSSFYKTK